jgi:dimethylargininase
MLAGVDIALTREVSPAIARCELTFLEREAIDFERAREQHQAYCEALQGLGLELVRLPADESCPDACFVEDTAVVLDELAVLTMPGAESRRAELDAVAQALLGFRRVERIALPATLDGGDVLRMGHRLFVGRSRRTSDAGIEALRGLAAPFRYEVVPVEVTGCLHLKSAVSALDDETVLANTAWFDASALAPYRILSVAASEPHAANVLHVRGQILGHHGFLHTLDRLDRHGYRVTPLDVSEFLKAEAGLSCKSILFRRV